MIDITIQTKLINHINFYKIFLDYSIYQYVYLMSKKKGLCSNNIAVENNCKVLESKQYFNHLFDKILENVYLLKIQQITQCNALIAIAEIVHMQYNVQFYKIQKKNWIISFLISVIFFF